VSASAAEPSIAELVSGLVNDAQELARKEVQLAKAEVREEVGKTLQASIALSIGALTVGMAALLLLFAAVYALVGLLGWSVWVSFLVVGVVVLVIGAIALLIGKSRLAQVNPVPQETIESLKEDMAWIKNQTP